MGHGTNGFTSLPKEGVLRIFSTWKIRRLRPGLNPRTLVPKASTLPLDHRSRLPIVTKAELTWNASYPAAASDDDDDINAYGQNMVICVVENHMVCKVTTAFGVSSMLTEYGHWIGCKIMYLFIFALCLFEYTINFLPFLYYIQITVYKITGWLQSCPSVTLRELFVSLLSEITVIFTRKRAISGGHWWSWLTV